MLARSKKYYDGLCPAGKRFIKLRAVAEDLTKTIDYYWRVAHEQGWNPPQHTSALPVVEQIYHFMTRREKVWAQRDRLVKKYNLDEDKVEHIFYCANLNRCGC